MTSPADIRALILNHENSRARSQQTYLGPSSAGHPCNRHIAYSLLGYDHTNPGGDKLRAIIGTATHAWLHEAAAAANTQLGRVRWLAEQPVEAWTNVPGGKGTLDLYDIDSQEVIDWKILGVTSMRDNARQIRPEYRVQLHTYGLGAHNLGLPVRNVSLCMIPRNGTFDGMQIITEPYDPQIALDARKRIEELFAIVTDPNLEAARINPLTLIPTSPAQPQCAYCPYWKPGSTSPDSGCAGAAPQTYADPLANLIAPTTQGAAA